MNLSSHVWCQKAVIQGDQVIQVDETTPSNSNDVDTHSQAGCAKANILQWRNWYRFIISKETAEISVE